MTVTLEKGAGNASGTGSRIASGGGGGGRRTVGYLLAALGAFILIVGLLALVYAPGALKKAPLDTNTVTVLDGDALAPTNFGDLSNLESAPVKVFSETIADPDLSDGDTVSYGQRTCLVYDQGGIEDCVPEDDPGRRLIIASTDFFATDRTTGEAVNDPENLGENGTEHTGLVNKWPFDAEKTDYMIWDSVIKDSVEATFVAEEQVLGLDTYRYDVSTSADDVVVVSDLEGSYTTESSYWVEPTTGSIIKREQFQERFLDGDQLILSLDVAYTDEQVQENAQEAADSVDSLNLVTQTVPLITLPLGLVLLLGGVFLFARTNREA